MARGESGRIVIEVDPQLKAELHEKLSSRGTTMKAWFLREAVSFLGDENPAIRRVAERAVHPYRATSSEGDSE